MTLTKSLASSSTAFNISKWLMFYPRYLLSVQDFIFLLFNSSIYINVESLFNHSGILKGKWSKAYKKLVDNGKIIVFNPGAMDSEFAHFLTKVNIYGGWKDSNLDDRLALLYCDRYEIPITFSIDSILTSWGKEILQRQVYDGEIESLVPTVFERMSIPGYSDLFSSFGSAFNEFAQIIGMGYEKDFLNSEDRKSTILQYDIETEVPTVKSENNRQIIENLKIELDSIYDKFPNYYKEQVSFDKFIYANLPHENHIDCSPDDFIHFLNSCDIEAVNKSYSKIQSKVTSRESLESLKQNKALTISKYFKTNNIVCSLFNVGLDFLKNKYNIPNEANFPQFHSFINKRIMKNSGWLLTINNFTTDLRHIK